MKFFFMAGLVSLTAVSAPVFTPMKDLVPLELRMSVKAKRKAVKALAAPDYGPDRVVTLSERDTPVKMQFGSTCTTFGLVAAMENLHGAKVDLSERHLWNFYRQYSMMPALAAAKKNLIVEEKAWPSSRAYRPARLPQGVLRVKDAPYLGDSILNIIKSIDAGYPVYMASEVVKDFGDCRPVVGERSPVVKGAGHAYAVVGYRVNSQFASGVRFLVKNSWGTRCGVGGYQWMPASICTRPDTSCYAWAIRALAAG